MAEIDYTGLIVIATFIVAIGTVIGIALNNRNQKKTLGLQTELEILKILADENSRKARILVYEAYRRYKKDNDLSIFDFGAKELDFQTATATVRADFDTIGSILYKRQEFLDDFLETWLTPPIVCYKALKDNIEDVETKIKFKDYMKFFKWLYDRAECEWKIRYPGVPSPEPW